MELSIEGLQETEYFPTFSYSCMDRLYSWVRIGDSMWEYSTVCTNRFGCIQPEIRPEDREDNYDCPNRIRDVILVIKEEYGE